MFKVATTAAILLSVGIAFSAAPAGAQYRFDTKEPVFAEWNDGKWYPGYLESQSNGNYTVKFWDGDRAIVRRTNIRRDTLKRGDRLLVRKHNGNKRATLTERHGIALVVTYTDGSKEAVPMSAVVIENLSTHLSASDPFYKPAVLANICNNTSQTVYFALAMYTSYDGRVGHASEGWNTIAAGACKIQNLTQFWRSQMGYRAEYKFIARTYIYGQTKDAFQTSIGGGAIDFGGGKRWGGDDAGAKYCIMDRPNISFRHVVDPRVELYENAYCKDSKSFKVMFSKFAVPLGEANGAFQTKDIGAVVNWTFGE